MALSFNVNTVSKQSIFRLQDQTVPGRQEKYVLHKKIPTRYILRHECKQDTSFLECKHKHMMIIEAPPNKFAVLYRLLPTEFHGFNSKIEF